jgi:hypothetical protein
MRKSIRAALVVVATLAATTVALWGSPASASPAPSSLQTMSKDFYGNAPGGITATLACPSGSRMVGGGGGHAQILAITPSRGFTAVTVLAALIYPAPSNFLSVWIVCAPANQFTDVVTVTTTDHTHTAGFRRGLSRCPAGRYAFGGGGYYQSGGLGVLGAAYNNVSNTPSADGTAWTFSGVAPEKNDDLVIITQCAPRVGRDHIVQAGFVAGSSSTANGYADCPAGFTVIDGGFYLSNPDGTEATPGNVIYSLPVNRGNGITGWFVSGNVATNLKVVALAQCIF